MSAQFDEIEIRDFRGFDYLKLDGLNRMNVFVGANNVGKTSMLEAIFLLSGMSNPQILNRVTLTRTAKAQANNLDATRYLFHNVNTRKGPLLKGKSGDDERELTFSPVFSNDENDLDAISSVNQTQIKQINFKFSLKNRNGICSNSWILQNDGAVQNIQEKHYDEILKCLFLTADKNDYNASLNFSTLVKRGKKQEVTDVLKNFDSRIEAVEALPDGLYLKQYGLEELLPISMAGDGIRRMINIMSSIMNEDHNMVLIDEIDNGLHFSGHKLMWYAILKFMQTHRVQVFVTTHNLDCLLGLNRALQENAEFHDMVNVYNIAKTRDAGFQTYRYGYADLNEAISNEIEIRR